MISWFHDDLELSIWWNPFDLGAHLGYVCVCVCVCVCKCGCVSVCLFTVCVCFLCDSVCVHQGNIRAHLGCVSVCECVCVCGWLGCCIFVFHWDYNPSCIIDRRGSWKVNNKEKHVRRIMNEIKRTQISYKILHAFLKAHGSPTAKRSLKNPTLNFSGEIYVFYKKVRICQEINDSIIYLFFLYIFPT